MSIARYYAWLSWFQDLARGVSHDTGQRTFTVHRHLMADDGSRSGEVLHERLLTALGATSDATTPGTLDVLDAGCGLGGTVLFLHARLGGRYTGITLSPTQAQRATAEAARRGVADACRFVVRDYDSDLSDLVPAGVDLAIAIESLAHAPDPAATIARLAARIRPGGRLLLVDDVPDDTLPPGDPDVAGFRDGWLCPAILGESALRAALASAGLVLCHDDDLTRRLHPRGGGRLAILTAASGAASWLLQRTPAQVLMGALHGGLKLERLYQRGLVRYRLIVARRPGPSHTAPER